MAKRVLSTFDFEKIRSIHRGKHSELWEGKIQQKSYVVKRFVSVRSQQWEQFEIQTRICHPALLQPHLAGRSSTGNFCYAMPVEFVPEEMSTASDLDSFTIPFLSLAVELQKRNWIFGWNPDHLVQDPKTGRVYLAGLSFIRRGSSVDLRDNEDRFFTELRSLLKARSMSVLGTLRKWERRKTRRLDGCLEEMLQQSSAHIDSCIGVFEWKCLKEIEVTTGLFHLAEHRKGRAVVFESDPGGGRSVLLRQIYRDMLPRCPILTFYCAQKEERPYHSIRKLFDLFFENTGAYRRWKSELTRDRWINFIDGSLNVVDEVVVSNFIRFLEKLWQRDSRVFCFLIDDIHLFDSASLRLLFRLIQEIESCPVLLVLTSRSRSIEVSDRCVTLTLEPATFSTVESAYSIPFWKRQQRSAFCQQIFRRTAGNPQHFHQYLLETFRTQQSDLVWKDEQWLFSRQEVPDFPGALLDFHLREISTLPDAEQRLLEMASVQGETFETGYLEGNESACDQLLQSLVEKGILVRFDDRFRFRKTPLAEALYQRMDPHRLRKFHLKLAGEMLKGDAARQEAVVALHFLKGGDYPRALSFACQAVDACVASADSVLHVLEGLSESTKSLTPADQSRLYTQKGEILFRKGIYPAAVDSFYKALQIGGSDPTPRFDVAVRIAEAQLLNNDILAAQKVLNGLDQILDRISEEKLLLRFYLARGVCGWHRGERRATDFEKAFEIAEKRQDYEALANGCRQRAELALREGVLTETVSFSRKALRYAKKTNNHQEAGHALRILGSVAWRQSRHLRAERILKRGIQSFRKIENTDGIARIWSLLGNIYAERHRFSEAVDAFQKAILLFSRINHPLEFSLAQFNLGLVYMEQCRLQDAEKIFLRCCSLDRKAGNKRYYAYDLRALGVLAILRGFHKKAGRLLRRTIEICEELHAEDDLLQTRMIFALNEIEQKNYRQAQAVLEFLQSKLPGLQQPMASAEIHYLLAHYFGDINDTEKALHHANQSLQIARRIRYHKLVGKNLILRLIFKNKMPGRTCPDFRRAVRYFERSRNDLEFADFLLKLYQAYPSLLQQKEHARRLAEMEKVYRKIRHRPKHRIVRQLSRGSPSQRTGVEPLYEWWYGLLAVLQGREELGIKIKKVLQELTSEIHASASMLQFLNHEGSWERFWTVAEEPVQAAEDLLARLLASSSQRKEALCIDPVQQQEFATTPWVVLHKVRSILVVPILKTNKPIGMWYFERRGEEPAFSRKDVSKASFFSMAGAPILENLFHAEFATRAQLSLPASGPFEDLIGSSKKMMELYRQMSKLASLDISVLILGESGTGKELVARNLHRKSHRASSPFLALNCSAIPETLIESELFGYVRGAFTGASTTKPGLIERASGGTLFLDEIGDLSAAAQAKLLRVMQEREIQRLGDTITRKIDVRFLFATHKDLARMVQEGSYREDLFYRISVYSLVIPPLRERREDIPRLLSHLLSRYGRAFGKSSLSFSPAAISFLSDYSWPGNVREMENLIQGILVNADSNSVIDVSHLPASVTGKQAARRFVGMKLDQARQEFEKDFVIQVLERNRWNKTHTAQELGITRQGLVSMIQRLDLKKSH